MVFKKGLPPWNKGLTAETDARVLQNAIGVSKALKGKEPPNKGKKASEKAKESLRVASKLRWERKEEHEKSSKSQKERFLLNPIYNKGKTKDNCDSLQKLSNTRKDMFLNGELFISEKAGRGKGGYREDLGHYVRSSWEANYCRFLKWFGINYEYEPTRFALSSNESYLPDFYLPELDLYKEVKGYMDNDSERKIKYFAKDYPEKRLSICDSTEYETISQYASEIPYWE